MEIPILEVTQRVSSDSKNYYRVLQPLGEGGNSHVYLVEAMTGDNKGLLFALKLFIRVNDPSRLGRFNQEVDFLIDCNHPSIMDVYDKGIVPFSLGGEQFHFPYVIAEYLPQTLHDAIRSGLSMIEKVAFTLQLLSGLTYLSSRSAPIVHRDIKPQNIFVRGKACVLGDFGLMKILDNEDLDDKNYLIESTGPRLPRFYRTPDLVNYCRGKAPLSTKTDVFQLGLVLAKMFTDQSPLKPSKEILDPVELDILLPIRGSQGFAIASQINKMLEMDPSKRLHASDLFDTWEGIFIDVVKVSQQLEGRIF